MNKTSELFLTSLSKVGSGEETPEEGYSELASTLEIFVRENGYDVTTAGYFQAAVDLRDDSFPDWPLAGVPYDWELIPDEGEISRSMARAIGMYFAVALEELTGDKLIGAKRIDQHLEKSGLYPRDVWE